MKSIVLTIFFALNIAFAIGQNTQFGLQGGLNYNFSGDLTDLNTIGNAGDDIIHGVNKSVGYHGGLWGKVNFTDLFLKGELLYTQYKTDFGGTPAYSLTTEKLDIPLVLGAKVLGPVYIFAGPDFQYILQEDFSLQNSDIRYDDFTMGLHVGAGVDFGVVSLDVRWDKGLSGSESQIVNSEFVNENFTLDNRQNQIVVSLNISLSGK